MDAKLPVITMTEVTDPAEIAASNERMAHFERNYQWLAAHASEVFSHRGMHICIAGQELFVGDDIREVLDRARNAHPEDKGPYFKYIPVTRGPRIYAHRWIMAGM